MRLVALAAPKQTGKSTFATAVTHHLAAAGRTGQRRSFADGLRSAAKAFFGLTQAQAAAFDDPALKEAPLPGWGLTPRHIMQLLGTEGFRAIFGADIHLRREDLWVAEVGCALAGRCACVLYDDCRFDNEAAWIRAHGGLVVHLRRAGRPAAQRDPHPSEAGVAVCPGDLVFRDLAGDAWSSDALDLIAHLEEP